MDKKTFIEAFFMKESIRNIFEQNQPAKKSGLI